MSTTPISQRYYPSLSTVLSLDAFPEELDFIKNAVDGILERLFYKDLQFHKSPLGDAASYNLALVSRDRLDVQLPGIDIALILNPDVENQDISAFPILLEYEWKLLAYLRNLDLANFSFNPQEIFELALKALNISEREALAHFVNVFAEPADAATTTPLQQFVQDINAGTGLNVATPDASTTIDVVIEEIFQQAGGSTYGSLVAFGTYILDPDIDATKDKLALYFQALLPQDVGEFVKELIIPRVRAAVGVSAGIEFPRSILKPMKLENGAYIVEPDETIKTMLQLDAGYLQFDSETGFDFNKSVLINFQQPYDRAQIGSTGFSISFANARIAFPKKRKEDGSTGYGADLFIEEASLWLPDFWKQDDDNSNVDIYGEKLHISEDKFSGKVGIRKKDPNDTNPALLKAKLGENGLSIQLNEFSATFIEGRVRESILRGTLSIPTFKDGDGNDAELNVTGYLKHNGFYLRVEEPQGLVLSIDDKVEITLFALAIGRKDGNWFFELKSSLHRIVSVPVVGDLLPEYFHINHLHIGQGVTPAYNLGIEWPGEFAVSVTNNGIPDTVVPINKMILGVLDLDTVQFSAQPQNPGLDIPIVVDGGLQLGPVYASVQDFGIRTSFTFPQAEDGKLGPMDVSIDLKPPLGIGVTIESNMVKGGGLLYYEPNKERYVGVLELTIKDKISVKAVGIITTKLPDGKEGFSLLVLITVSEFSVPLGFGFKLKGVGGLIGTHRSLSVSVLREGVKNDSLDLILFPENPVENIGRIVSVLDKAFPLEMDRHAFGLMAKIGWGSPQLVDVELGFMLEVPEPVKLAILGVVKVVLPSESLDIVRIQVNFLGVIDFEKKYISFDASIYDSRLLSFRLAGDMAFRLLYGNRPNFLLTVGGFHPDFVPPPLNLPDIQRLTINFVNKRKLKITLQFYMALTSNSIQGGARLDLFAGPVLGFAAVGLLSFDALFQFSPFYFNVHIQAGIAIVKVKKNKKVLGIYLSLQVEGPKPWRVKGVVEVVIIVKVKIKVNATIGRGDRKDKLPDVNVLPLLKEAIFNPDSWETIAPANSNLLVTIREMKNTDGKLVIQPSGKLAVKQKVMPLRTTIKKFGKQNPSGHRWLDIEVRNNAGQAWTKQKDLKEWFAPADFQEMSNSQKVKAPSFQQMNAGQLIASGDRSVVAGAFRQIRCEYEQIVMERRYEPPTIGTFHPPARVFARQVKAGSAARSALGRLKKKGASPFVAGAGRAGALRSTLAPKRVQVGAAQTGGFAIVGARDLQLFENMTAPSQAEAKLALDSLLDTRPELRGQLKVMPDFARPLVQ